MDNVAINWGVLAASKKQKPVDDSQQYYNEMLGAMQGQSRVYPQALDLERGLMPQLQGYQSQVMGSQYQNLLGQYGAMQGSANQAQGDYQQQLLGMYGMGGNMATNSAIQNLGYGGQNVYNQFMQQAGQGLSMGSGLSPEDQTYAQQSARAAMSARGLTGNQAVGQEVLNSYQLGNQRLQQRQQMGLQAYQMANQQQAFGQQAYLNPAMQQSQGVYGLGQMYGATQNSFQNLGPQFLQPESQYLANIRANRISGENADKAASAQESSGLLSAVGNIAAAYVLKGCWVAREVYGTETGEWFVFRQWMENESPRWFKSLYYQDGERFAKFISNKPFLKSIVKSAMDIVVKPRLNLIKFYA
jgi:hypothetical protein